MDDMIPITAIETDSEPGSGADLSPYRFFEQEIIDLLDDETIQILVDDKIATGG